VSGGGCEAGFEADMLCAALPNVGRGCLYI
jgi:hypothetical protein